MNCVMDIFLVAMTLLVEMVGFGNFRSFDGFGSLKFRIQKTGYIPKKLKTGKVVEKTQNFSKNSPI